jgi:hypothetical protein
MAVKKIIQISEADYNELIEKANYNVEQIRQEAEKIWEETGKFKITIGMYDTDKISEYEVRHTIKVDSFISEWGNDTKIKLNYDEKKRIVKFVNERVTKFIKVKYGKNILAYNKLLAEIEKLKNFKAKWTGIMIFGWLLSVGIIILSILK